MQLQELLKNGHDELSSEVNCYAVKAGNLIVYRLVILSDPSVSCDRRGRWSRLLCSAKLVFLIDIPLRASLSSTK